MKKKLFTYAAAMKPSAMVGYLGGNLNPEKVLQDNIRSIDYQYLVLLNTQVVDRGSSAPGHGREYVDA